MDWMSFIRNQMNMQRFLPGNPQRKIRTMPSSIFPSLQFELIFLTFQNTRAHPAQDLAITIWKTTYIAQACYYCDDRNNSTMLCEDKMQYEENITCHIISLAWDRISTGRTLGFFLWWSIMVDIIIRLENFFLEWIRIMARIFS